VQEHGNFQGPNHSGSHSAVRQSPINRAHTLPARVPPPLPSVRPNAGGTGQSSAVNPPAGPADFQSPNNTNDSVSIYLLLISNYLLLIAKLN